MNKLLDQSVASTASSLPLPLIDESQPLSGLRVTNHSGKYRFSFLLNMLKMADFAALLMAGFAGYLLRFGFSSTLSPASHLFIYLSTVVTMVALHMAKGYRVRALTSLSTQLGTLFVGGTSALFLILICGFLSGSLHDYSRIWLVLTAAIATVSLVVNRIVITKVVQRGLHNKQLMESIVIVGANEHAEKLIASILSTPDSGINILGIFDDRVKRPLPPSLRLRLLGTTDNLLSFIRSNRVDRVVVALPWVASERINYLLKKMRTVPVRIDIVPSDMVWQFPVSNLERLGGVPVVTIANGRVDVQSGLVKRAEDLIISSLMLVLALPIMFLIALVIKIDSKGPVLFKQRRQGFNNQIFEVYKFRSMKISNSASTEITQATRNDPRITRVGRFLRRSSLDELPQLFNVLAGHMSIVGPRPHAIQHNVEYGLIISEYYARHNVKPGITGWAQVNGLRGETNTSEKMRRRVEADLHYIENWSLLMDLKIILMTGITVWFQEAAY